MLLTGKKLSLVENYIQEQYIIIDENQCIIEMHPNALEYFSIRPDPYVGKSIWELLGEYDVRELKGFFRKSVKGQPVSFDIHAEDERQLKIKVFPANSYTTILIKDKTKANQIEQILFANNRKLSLLSETANDLILSKEPKELLDSLFNHLSKHLEFDIYFNYIVISEEHKLRLMNYHGVPDDVAKQIEILDFGQAVCGCVAQNEDKIIAECISESDDPRVFFVKSLGIKAYACYPLYAYGKLVGTLSFGSKKKEKFSCEELELLEQVCSQTANALDRTYLIAELQAKNEQLNWTNEELLEGKDKLERANKAKSDFLLMMSHEFRTPLNTLNGYLEILGNDPNNPLSERQQKRLEKAISANQQLKMMINDLLDYVRYDNGKLYLPPAFIDVVGLINECIHFSESIAVRKKISITFDSGNMQDVQLLSSPERLKQVMVNILSNAIKYNKDNGSVHISCHLESKSLMIEVSDTGIGIKKEELHLIFTPFFRSPGNCPSIPGTGIGLSLVKQIVNEIGGTITVESEIGKGSTFRIRLPLT
jgi:signal transduction histidine kinase